MDEKFLKSLQQSINVNPSVTDQPRRRSFAELLNQEEVEKMRGEYKQSKMPLVEVRQRMTALVDSIYNLPEQLEYQQYMAIERQLPPQALNAVKGFFLPDDTYAKKVLGDELIVPEMGLLSSFDRPMHSARFVYPVMGLNREVLGLIGYDKFDSVKYLLSKTAGFGKNNMFYGMHMMRWIYKKGYIIILEGIVDPIFLWINGEPAIGLNGSIMSEFVVRIVKRFGYNVLFMPDSNETGEGAVKYWKRMIPDASILRITDGNDIDDWRKRNDFNKFKEAMVRIKSSWDMGLPREEMI